MKTLKNYLINIFEAKADPSTKDWEQFRDYFEQMYKWADNYKEDDPQVSENDYVKVSNNILDWCEKFGQKIPKFTNAVTQKYAGVIIIATEERIRKYGTWFCLRTFTNETTSGNWPQGFLAKNMDSKKWDKVLVHYGHRKLSRYDIMDINNDKDDFKVFGFEDKNIYAILDKNKFERGVGFSADGGSAPGGKKKSSGKYKDEFIEDMLSNINMKKSEIRENLFNWVTLEPAEIIDVTSMDEKKVIAQMTNIMLKENENALVLGVDDDEVKFTLFEEMRRGRFYMNGFAVAKAFKTLKVFKETFTQSNLKKLDVTQLRIYKPNK